MSTTASPTLTVFPAEAGPSFYIVAGEASGDRISAALLTELRAASPKCPCYGVGGPMLAAAGQDQLFDLAEHAVVGLTDVIANYSKFKGFFDRVLRDIIRRKPSALILTDYPGFNLELAKAVKRAMPKLPIIYYVSPQVWAWKKGRAKTMARLVDLLLVIFEFEKEWFDRYEPRLKVEWVGHPLMDRWQGPAERDSNDTTIRQIALLPGSRPKEIARHLPTLLTTARMLWHQDKQLRFVILASDTKSENLILRAVQEQKAETLHAEIACGYQLTHLGRSDLAVVASGSATLECCVAGVPMLVIYKVNPVTYAVGRMVTKIPYLAIVNLLAGKKVVPEFLQKKVTPDYLFQAIRRMQKDTRWSETMRAELAEVTAGLGKPGASKRAASEILKLVASRV